MAINWRDQLMFLLEVDKDTPEKAPWPLKIPKDMDVLEVHMDSGDVWTFDKDEELTASKDLLFSKSPKGLSIHAFSHFTAVDVKKNETKKEDT